MYNLTIPLEHIFHEDSLEHIYDAGDGGLVKRPEDTAIEEIRFGHGVALVRGDTNDPDGGQKHAQIHFVVSTGALMELRVDEDHIPVLMHRQVTIISESLLELRVRTHHSAVPTL